MDGHDGHGRGSGLGVCAACCGDTAEGFGDGGAQAPRNHLSRSRGSPDDPDTASGEARFRGEAEPHCLATVHISVCV